MANQKVSSFPDGAPVIGTDKFPFVRDGDPTNYVADAAEIAAYVGGNITLNANSVLANGGTAAAAGVSFQVGDTSDTVANTGLVFSADVDLDTGVSPVTLNTTSPTTYYLTPQPDLSGIADYYVAARTPYLTSVPAIPSVPLTGTTTTTVANFITPAYDPSGGAFPLARLKHLIYGYVDGGVITWTVQILKRSADGTETSLNTSAASAQFSSTTTAQMWVRGRKNGTSVLLPSDRLVFRVRATRVSGPTTINVTLATDTTNWRPTAQSSITGPGVPSSGYEYNVMSFGARGDAKAGYDGVMTAASTNFQSLLTTFTINDIGKKITVTGALGLASPPLLADITAYVDAHNVTLSAAATSNTDGIQSLSAASVEFGGSSGYYVPNDVVDLSGGTYSVQASAIVVSTTVRPPTDTVAAFTIVNAGSLGTPGNYIMNGTTGTGTPFKARVYVGSSGSATSVQYFSGGVYLANPGTAAEPITDMLSGLTGCTLAIGGIDPLTLGVNAGGSYTVLPSEPVETSAGSLSGATGLTIDPTWQGTGRFAYFTNDRDAIAACMQAAIDADAAQTRRDVVFPARMFGITGAALPVMTQPVRIQGGGRSQTTIYAAEGYAGPHVFGWSELFGSAQVQPRSAPNVLFSQVDQGAGAIGIQVDSDSTNTVLPDAFVIYDRCEAMFFSDYGAANVGSAFRTGILYSGTQSMLRESLSDGLYTRNCGSATQPVVYLLSVSPIDGDNYLTFNETNIAFPRGQGLVIDNQGGKRNGVKILYFNGLRIETPGNSVAAYDQLVIGTPQSTNAVNNAVFNETYLFSARPGASAILLGGITENTRPHDITFTNLFVGGAVLGTGITMASGYDIRFDGILNLGGRTAQIATGNHSEYRLRTTASSATSSTVVTATGPATDNGNVGAAVVLTVPVAFTASQSGTTITVSAVASGRLVPGTVVSGGGVPWITRVVTQLTGSTGSTGTYQVTTSKTLSSRAMTGTYTETHYVTGYVASTKTSTIGDCQGSGSAWAETPVSGDAIAFQSLVDGDLFINGYGAERSYLYSNGVGVDALWVNPVLASGVPTGVGTINRDLDFTGSATFSDAIITGGTIDGLGLGALTSGNAIYASGTSTLAQFAWPPNWTITTGTLVPSSTITVGLSNSLTDSITLGTYDLGPVLQGGTVLNSYAHVASGTLTYTGAIGAPGTYTAITGMSAITSSSTTIDTIGTATAANVLSAGQHLWVVVGGTLAPGGTVFFTVKVP